MAARGVALVALAVCVGCAKPAPPSAPPAALAPEAAEPEPQPDLSPVAAPEDLIVVGRLSRPRVMFETLASWSGVPVRVTDVLPNEAKELSGIVAWDAPIEVAGVLDRRSSAKVPAPTVVLSIGLTSVNGALELARSRGIQVTPVAPGISRLPVHDELACAISVAIGSAPGRLVCGADWSDVEELLPYATRGLPTAALGTGDLHVEFRAAPIQRRYLQELAAIRPIAGILLRNVQTDSKRLDRALTDTVYGLADEVRALATELQRLEITARLDEPRKGLEFGYALALNGEASVTGQLLRDTGRRASPAPDVFWQLPAAAEGATYQVASDPKRAEQWAATLVELADAYLEQQKLGAALRKRVRAVLESYVPAFWVASSSASGPTPEASAASGFGGFMHRGWSVGVLQTRADRVTKSLSDVSALLADREFGKLLKERFELDPKALPKVRRGTSKVRGFTAAATTYTTELSQPLLDFLARRKDGHGVASTFSDAPPKPAKPAKKATQGIAIVVVPDGERSWIAIAPDQKSAVARLEATRSAAEPQLASVPALEPLKRERAVLGGYWTLAALVNSLSSVANSDKVDAAGLLGRMPNHGRSLWLLDTRVAEQGSAVTLSARAFIPQATFQDAGSVGGEIIREITRLSAPGQGRLAGVDSK